MNVAVSEGNTVGKDEAINAKLCGRDYSTGMIGSLRTDRLTLTQERSATGQRGEWWTGGSCVISGESVGSHLLTNDFVALSRLQSTGPNDSVPGSFRL
jgi:hypothetical protein